MLRKLSDYHGIPVVAVHAPESADHAAGMGPRPVGEAGKIPRTSGSRSGRRSWWCIRRSAGSASTPGTSRPASPGCRRRRDVAFAVENLYPLLRGETEVGAYAPHWNPVEMDVAAATLDVSHAAVSDSDVLAMARHLGRRLTHVHMGDGTKPGLPDEHLVPGRGTQPCAELLGWLASPVSPASWCSKSARTACRRWPTGRTTWPNRWNTPGGTSGQPARAGRSRLDLPDYCASRISVTGPSLTSSTCMSAPKTPVCDGGAQRAQRVGEGGHQRLRHRSRRRRAPARPPALGRIGVQGELADDQQRRPGVRAGLLAAPGSAGGRSCQPGPGRGPGVSPWVTPSNTTRPGAARDPATFPFTVTLALLAR